MIPEIVCVPPATVRPPVPLIAPEKLPLAAVNDRVLAPNATEPAPEIPPSDTAAPALAKLRLPLAVT